MIEFNSYKEPDLLSDRMERAIVDFLFTHLEEYGDARKDIQKCMDYALGRGEKPGGLILTAQDGDDLVGAVLMNVTGMKDYIPENILVYIATHQGYRGQGIGKKLMEMAIRESDGNIALHVEPDNPAR